MTVVTTPRAPTVSLTQSSVVEGGKSPRYTVPPAALQQALAREGGGAHLDR